VALQRLRAKSSLALEPIHDRYCRSPRGVMSKRPAQLLLTYEWVEDWHRAIPHQYENYTHRLLEKVVQHGDQ
jgi:hypothetical protein